jgi:hypothetical protein
MAALNGVLAYLVLERWRPVPLLLAVAAGLGVTSLWFNPLVLGGAEYLRGNDLSRAILDIDRERKGDTTWAVYGDGLLANLLPSLGVRVLNGEQAIPQLDLWARLDASAEARKLYNRYAVIEFLWPPPRPRARVELEGGAKVTWFVHPAGPELHGLGVTHLLVGQNPAVAPFFERFVPLARVHGKRIFELPLVRAREDGGR